jgi:hypothetical protein
VIDIELPETLEEIVVWKLENVHVESYLLHVQLNSVFFAWPTRILVLEWLARIHALGIVTSSQTYSTQTYIDALERQYHTVSVAGIQICIMTSQEHKEIFGETHA